MPERPTLTGLLILTADLPAVLLTWRSLGFRVVSLETERALLEGHQTRVYVELEADGHRAEEAYPIYETPQFDAVVDAFESQGGRTLEVRTVASRVFHLLIAPTGHRLAVTKPPAR